MLEMSLEDLPGEIIASLQTILGPAPEPEYEAASYSLEGALNALLVDDSSLRQIDQIQYKLTTQITEARLQVDALQEEFAQTATNDTQKMAQVQEHISDLFTQINHLRSGATESESVVRDITRDIKTLDLAKRNIVTSMTTVKRYQMLVNGLDQLTRLVKGKRYKESAQSLLAIKQLQQYFVAYAAIDRITTIARGVQSVQNTLRAQVMADFESAFNAEHPIIKNNQSLADASLVVDALGQDTKHNLLNWYCNLQLKDYRRIFKAAEEAGQLDNISRRFAWFRRILKHYEDEHAGVFPQEWLVGGVLVGAFTTQTRDDLKSVLTRSASTLSVNLLLESLQTTIEFEKELAQRFSLPFEKLAAMAPVTTIGTTTPISAVFEPYLSIFVDAQDRTIAEYIASYRANRRTSTDSESESTSHVFPSSSELFYFYRETLEKCARLSNKTPFLDLCGVYKKWLKVYCEDVLASTLTSLHRDTRRSSSDSRPNIHELNNACMVINTADYCADTAAQLEERLKERIAPELKERVSLEAEKDMFLGVISLAVTTLLRELELTVESAFQHMLRSPWRDVEIVSTESAYVREIVQHINSVASVAKDRIEQPKYSRSFCDRVVGFTVSKVLQTIVRCRPISTIGAEQILLDLQGIRSCLVKLQASPTDGKGSSFTRLVNKNVGRIESLLKGIMTAESPPDEFVKNYLILVPCQSFSDFQKMLDLKGVRRTEQNTLLDTFLSKTSTMTDLSDTSFLSALDMEPNPSHSLTMPSSPNLSASPIGGIFNSIAMFPSASREGSNVPSRSGTPNLTGVRNVSFGERPDASALRKFGSRFFGQ